MNVSVEKLLEALGLTSSSPLLKKNIPIESASVRVMRSYDYNHFEVCLTSSSTPTPRNVDELRKSAQRLADRAVEQFKVAKEAEQKKASMYDEWRIRDANNTPESERTPEQKAVIKYHSDAAFASTFDYDYDEDYEL